MKSKRSVFAPPWRDAANFVATFGGIGLLPGAPGTWGALAALPVGWAVLSAFGWPGVLAAAAAATVAGLWASRAVIRRTRQGDPPAVVIDEVAGQLLCLTAVEPRIWQFALAFGLFRVVDIAKPFPLSWLERKLGGGFGVMADDLMAGIYALAGTAAAVALIEEAAP